MARKFPWIIEVQLADGTWKRVNRGGTYMTTCYEMKWQAEHDRKWFKAQHPTRKFRARDLRKEI